MEITTKMSSPSSRTSTKTIIFKLIIIGILLYILIHNPTLSPSLECSEEEGKEECKVEVEAEVEAEVKANYDTIVTFMDTMNMDNILISINYFVNEKLPRYVASALLIHVGICCGYVGLVHMQIISPD